MKNQKTAAPIPRLDSTPKLTPDELRQLIGVDLGTLAKWRCQRQGPPFIKVSRRCVRYDHAAVMAWLEASTVATQGGGQ